MPAPIFKGNDMTPERREELYNIPSSELTDAQIIEYMKDTQNRVAPQHIQSELLARFEKYSNISVSAASPEGLESVRSAIVKTIAFLNRDIGTARATKTIDQILPLLVSADKTLLAALQPKEKK
jgi:hypothetical protein